MKPVAWTSRANLRVLLEDQPFYAAVMGPKNTAEMNVPLYTAPLEVTDHMVESALGDYSEGGCMGLDTAERREVVSAIIQSALDSARNNEPPER